MNRYSKRPNIPGLAGLSQEVRAVLDPVKHLLEIHEGRRGNPSLDRFVKIGEVGHLLSIESRLTPHARPYNENAPAPPTNVEVLAGPWGNRISWTNATDDDLWAVEVFAATTNDWTQSELVATVTIPPDKRGERSQYVHYPEYLLIDHYYWVRSVDYSGNASRLAPPGENDGLLAPGEDTIGQTVDRILEILGTPNAPLYNPDKEDYRSGDIVEFNNKLYQCFNSPVPAGVEPDSTEGADYWRRTGILVQGDVDGKPTVGINGELAVDQSILARSIRTDQLQVGTNISMQDGVVLIGHIGFALEEGADVTGNHTAHDVQNVDGVSASTIMSRATTGYNHSQDAHAPSNADNTQSALNWGAAIDDAKVNNYTLIDGGYINTAVLFVAAANIGEAEIGTLHLDGNTVTVPYNVSASEDIVGNNDWQTALYISFNTSVSGEMIYAAFCCNLGHVSTNTWQVRLLIDGTIVFEAWGHGSMQDVLAMEGQKAKQFAGNVVVKAEFKTNSNVTMKDRFLSIQGAKR